MCPNSIFSVAQTSEKDHIQRTILSINRVVKIIFFFFFYIFGVRFTQACVKVPLERRALVFLQETMPEIIKRMCKHVTWQHIYYRATRAAANISLQEDILHTLQTKNNEHWLMNFSRFLLLCPLVLSNVKRPMRTQTNLDFLQVKLTKFLNFFSGV